MPKKLRVAINGFGRIGRCLLRSYLEAPTCVKDVIEIVAINAGSGSINDRVHNIKYDSTHGVLKQKIDVISESEMIVDDHYKIAFLFEKDIGAIDWLKLGADTVLECTGQFTQSFTAHQHLQSGAKRVIVSAPYDAADATIVLGANDHLINANHTVISIGSCTTNCLAPIAKALHESVGIESGFMTTIHAYTNDQLLLDGSHKDLRRSRAAPLSMIPATTGAAKAMELVVPELLNRLDGAAVRVPVANVSMIDFKFVSRKHTSVANINLIMEEKARVIPNILSCSTEPLVSCDFNHTTFSAIFDSTSTRVVNNNFCRIIAWYDNEWAFSNRMLEVAKQYFVSNN